MAILSLLPTQSPSPGPPALGPRRIHWTCDEFHRLGDMGAFEGRRAMLIHGVILEEGPMIPPHAITLELVEEALRAAFGAGWRFRSQSPLVLGQDVDPEPDLVVIAGTPRSDSAHPAHPTSADLLIEVADSSLDFDTNEKRLLYAKAGIRDYWVVDVNGRQVLVYRNPNAGDYSASLSFSPADAISPLAKPTASVRVADLLM